MNMKLWTITPMTRHDSWESSNWKYEGIYAFYNPSPGDEPVGDATEIVEGSYAVRNERGELVGQFHFGRDGRIPTIEENPYTGDYLDFGLGLRPDLCGQKLGPSFVLMGLAFGQEHYGTANFRLSVAAFNERAIRVYEKCGFRKIRSVTNSYFKNEFYIMTLISGEEAP